MGWLEEKLRGMVWWLRDVASEGVRRVLQAAMDRMSQADVEVVDGARSGGNDGEAEREKRKVRAVTGESHRISMSRWRGGDLGRSSHLYRTVGNSNIGEKRERRLITGSGDVIKPEEAKAICSCCGQPERVSKRSDLSGVVLCQCCGKFFRLGNGRRLWVSPEEYSELYWNYDTWDSKGD